MIVAITHDGNVIRTPVEEFNVQNVKTSGIYNKYYTGGIRAIQQTSLEETLLLFTEKGLCLPVKVADIPCTDTLSEEISLKILTSIEDPFCAILAVSPLLMNSTDYSVLIMTNNCKIMRQRLADYRDNGKCFRTVTLDSDDIISSVVLANKCDVIFHCTNYGYGKLFDVDVIHETVLASKSKGRHCYNPRRPDMKTKMAYINSSNNNQDKLIIISKDGYFIKIGINEVRNVFPLASCGVKIMNLKDGGEVISSVLIDGDVDLLIVTKKGYVARHNISLFKDQHRGGNGSLCMTLSAEDKIVACCKISPRI